MENTFHGLYIDLKLYHILVHYKDNTAETAERESCHSQWLRRSQQSGVLSPEVKMLVYYITYVLHFNTTEQVTP